MLCSSCHSPLSCWSSSTGHLLLWVYVIHTDSHDIRPLGLRPVGQLSIHQVDVYRPGLYNTILVQNPIMYASLNHLAVDRLHLASLSWGVQANVFLLQKWILCLLYNTTNNLCKNLICNFWLALHTVTLHPRMYHCWLLLRVGVWQSSIKDYTSNMLSREVAL